MRSSKKVIKAQEVKVSGRKPVLVPSPAAEEEVLVSGGPAEEQPSQPSEEERIGELCREAYEKGLREGRRQGINQQRQEVSQLTKTLAGLVEELTRIKGDFGRGLEGEIVELAFAIAEKVVAHEVTSNRETIWKVMEAAAKKVVDRRGMRIRINPVDFRHLAEVKEELSAGREWLKEVVWEQDPNVGRGGVVIDSLFGEIDARLDQQLEELRKALKPS